MLTPESGQRNGHNTQNADGRPEESVPCVLFLMGCKG